jgi:polyhydroxybutyrate depolymerase
MTFAHIRINFLSMRLIFIYFFLLPCLSVLSQTTVEGTFFHEGIERDHRLYIPAVYDPAIPAPLLFNLHGFGIHNQQQEAYGDFRPIADTAGFIIAHPNGTLNEAGYRFWNAFGMIEVDDAAYIEALIDTISAHYSIDPTRIYCAGMSNGGMMTYELACHKSERFAAVASVTGTMLVDRLAACAPTHPMPVLQIHGTADEIVPFAGGNGMVSVGSLLNYWIAWNTSSPVPVIEALPNVVPSDGSTVEHHVHAGLVSDVPVELFKVIDGPHSWPGTPFGPPGTNQDIDASVEIWRFLRRFDLVQLTTGMPSIEHPGAGLYPNPFEDRFQLHTTDGGPAHVRIHNATGALVVEQFNAPDRTTFTIDAPGIYLVNVVQHGRSTCHRMVKL